MSIQASRVQQTPVSRNPQTIFHPDDGVDLALLRIACETCEGPAYLKPESVNVGIFNGVAVPAYRYRCSNPRCSARVTLQVPRGVSELPEGLRLPADALQTFFHPEDGIPLEHVVVSCETCGKGSLLPRSKTLEEVESGPWTIYTYHHREICPVELLIRVPHQATSEVL